MCNFISETVLLTGAGAELHLKYYLLNQDGYGVGIECNEEKLNILSVTSSESDCLGLIEKLSRCGVTPTTALDVIEDWL